MCLTACAAALAGAAIVPAGAHGAAQIDVDGVSPVLRAGKPAFMRVRLSFTGERSCRLRFTRGRVTQVTPDSLTEHRLVTWRWRVPRDARSGHWTLLAECGAEAELTVRVAQRLRLEGLPAGRRRAAAHVNVFNSGDPLVVAFVRRP